MIFLFPINFLNFLENVQPQNCQNRFHYHHLHTNLSNEFLLIHTHQDLLHMPHPLCG